MGELQGAGAYGWETPTATGPPTCSRRPTPPATSPWRRPDERLGAALAARNHAELDRLVADLPPEWRAGQDRGQRPAGPPQRQRPAFPPEVAWLVPLAVIVTGVILLAVHTRGFCGSSRGRCCGSSSSPLAVGAGLAGAAPLVTGLLPAGLEGA